MNSSKFYKKKWQWQISIFQMNCALAQLSFSIGQENINGYFLT